ncbi:MAG: beta-propeller fold lactonase family protein [Brevinema sp.]
MLKCFIGTYLSDGGEGVYQLDFDPTSRKILNVALCCPAEDSKYLYIEKEEIFSIFKGKKQCGVAVYRKNGTLIDSVEYENSASCYVIKHLDYVYTANYHEGTITKLHYNNGSLKIVSQKLIKEKAGCHQIIFLKDRLLIPCLLLDKMFILDFELNIVGELDFPAKAGPRHGIISRDGKYLYLLGELDDALYTFLIENREFILQDRQSLLVADSPPAGASAALRMSNDGKTLMASTRGANQITLIDISKGIPVIKSRYPSGGDHPRDMLNVLNDSYLVVAHKTSGTVVIFALNKDYTLEKCSEASIKGAVAISVLGE